MFEKLEARRLLTATLHNGVLTITGGAAGDSLIAENNGQHIQTIENGSKMTKFKADKVNHIVFNGLAGNDTLTNRSNKPSIMNGGGDNDIMIGSPTTADDFNGGSESDTVTYASRTQDLALSVGGASDGANGGAEQDNIRGDVERVVGGSGNDNISGSANAETLEGGPGNDELHGLAGNDVLIGSVGNDLVDGGDDSDNMDGGEGDDRYFETPRFLPTVDAMIDSAGTDTLDFSGSFTKLKIDMALDAGQVQDLNGDASARLFGVFENGIGGPFSTTLRGNEVNNILDNRFATFDSTVEGRGGNDWLIGSPFVDDNMFGGGGNDLFDGVSQGKDGGDLFDGGAGFDTLDLSHRSGNLFISTDSDSGSIQSDGEAGEQDEVKSTEHVIGGSGNDQMRLGDDANVAANYWFEGRAGQDFLQPLTAVGSCTLQGGDGVDLCQGGHGNDLVDGGGSGDDISGGEGNDTLDGGGGGDGINFTDSVSGDAGDDVYRETRGGFEVFNEPGLNEKDTLDFSNAPSGITIELVPTQPQAINAAGDVIRLNGSFENVIGSRFGDDILGSLSNNTIHAGDGNDTVDGILGDDFIYGENGDDELAGSFDRDFVDGGAGNDHLSAEGDIFITSARDTLMGGEGNDTIEGGPGNDSLLGGNGDDVLSGGDDNDTLKGEAGHDQLFGDAGDDTLIANDGEADTLDGGNGGEVAGDTAFIDGALDIVSNCETSTLAKSSAGSAAT